MKQKLMSYQVLALKYRPQSFDEAIGQETTTTTLKNAILKQRLHHAYLFTGPRGVGKTSLARIFAKALNCETGPTPEPCQKCVACQEITGGQSLDVQEIDGASHTSVEDIRTLRENVKYTPGSGRYRIYIIDEVHMLSKSAFAALLKTLEEPPEHVCFIFATTDPEKIPATILSRVLRFDFRRPSTELLLKHLDMIVKGEKIKIERDGLLWITRRSEGSVRDALSLLDRVTSFAGKKITTEQVLSSLGISGRHAVFQLLENILASSTEEALSLVQKLYNDGQDLKQFGLELMEAIRDVLMYKVLGDASFADWGEAERNSLDQLAAQSETADLEFLFHLFHRSYRDLVQSPLPKAHLEITILRMCTREKRENLSQILEKLESLQGAPQINTPDPHPSPQGKANKSLEEKSSPSWEQFVQFVEKKKASLAPMLARAEWQGADEKTIQVGLPTNEMYRALLKEPERQKLVSELAQEYFKKTVSFHEASAQTSTEEATEKPQPSSIVDEAISIFNPQKTQYHT